MNVLFRGSRDFQIRFSNRDIHERLKRTLRKYGGYEVPISRNFDNPTSIRQNTNFIHLLPNLEGDMKICPTQKIHVARGRHEFSGWDKSLCLPTNWAINCLLYRKLKHDVLQRRALCRETRQGNTTSGGRHDDVSSLHVTSLDQSYFFFRHINYMKYNKTS